MEIVRKQAPAFVKQVSIFFYQRTVILMHGHKYLETPKYLLRRLKSPYT